MKKTEKKGADSKAEKPPRKTKEPVETQEVEESSEDEEIEDEENEDGEENEEINEEEREKLIEQQAAEYTLQDINAIESEFRDSISYAENAEYEEKREEVYRFIVKVKQNPTAELKDMAITMLVRLFKKYIYHLINRTTRRSPQDADDLFQIGCEALMKYFDRYDPFYHGKKTLPTTFYTPYINESIKSECQRLTNQHKSSHYQKHIKRVTDAESEAMARGLDPSDLMILSILSGLPIKGVQKGLEQRKYRILQSLDAEGAENYVDDRDSFCNPEYLAIRAERASIINDVLSHLKVPHYEIMIYKLFYGFEVPGVECKPTGYPVSHIASIMNKSKYGKDKKFYPAMINDIVSKIFFQVRHNKRILALDSVGITRNFFASGGTKLVPNDSGADYLELYDFMDDFE